VNRSVAAGKVDESQILDAAPLVIRIRKDDDLGNVHPWRQMNLVVRLGQGEQGIVGFFRRARYGCLFPDLVDGAGKFGPRKSVAKAAEDRLCVFCPRIERLQLPNEVSLLEMIRNDSPKRPGVSAGQINDDRAVRTDQALPKDNR
jgi:hypothetical protein